MTCFLPGQVPYFVNLDNHTVAEVYENEPPGTYVYTVLAYNNFSAYPMVPPEFTYRINNITGGDECNVSDWYINMYTGKSISVTCI